MEEEDKQKATRYQIAANELYYQTRVHFEETWNVWSNAKRKVITAIALAQISGQVDTDSFHWANLVKDIDDNFSDELDDLEVVGTIKQTANGGWHIRQEALLWWLVDVIIKPISRDDTVFEEWLRAQRYGPLLLTEQEQNTISNAARVVGRALAQGAATLIETFASGLGGGLVKVTTGIG